MPARTGGRRHLHCLQAQTHSSYTPPSKIVRHQRMASAQWSSPSSRLRTGHSPWPRSTCPTSRRKLFPAPRAATPLRRFSLKRRMPNHLKPNEPKTPNHALQRTRPSRGRSSLRDPDAVYRDCNPRVPWAGSLSRGRWRHPPPQCKP